MLRKKTESSSSYEELDIQPEDIDLGAWLLVVAQGEGDVEWDFVADDLGRIKSPPAHWEQVVLDSLKIEAIANDELVSHACCNFLVNNAKDRVAAVKALCELVRRHRSIESYLICLAYRDKVDMFLEKTIRDVLIQTYFDLPFYRRAILHGDSRMWPLIRRAKRARNNFDENEIRHDVFLLFLVLELCHDEKLDRREVFDCHFVLEGFPALDSELGTIVASFIDRHEWQYVILRESLLEMVLTADVRLDTKREALIKYGKFGKSENKYAQKMIRKLEGRMTFRDRLSENVEPFGRVYLLWKKAFQDPE